MTLASVGLSRALWGASSPPRRHSALRCFTLTTACLGVLAGFASAQPPAQTLAPVLVPASVRAELLQEARELLEWYPTDERRRLASAISGIYLARGDPASAIETAYDMRAGGAAFVAAAEHLRKQGDSTGALNALLLMVRSDGTEDDVVGALVRASVTGRTTEAEALLPHVQRREFLVHQLANAAASHGDSATRSRTYWMAIRVMQTDTFPTRDRLLQHVTQAMLERGDGSGIRAVAAANVSIANRVAWLSAFGNNQVQRENPRGADSLYGLGDSICRRYCRRLQHEERSRRGVRMAV